MPESAETLRVGGRETIEGQRWSGLRLWFWVVGILAAAAQAIEYRQWINGDTISYLDMSDGISAHDLIRLVNPQWSPLYPFLIGVANSIIRPSAAWEFPVLHLVNFLCFLFAFAAFEFLLLSMRGATTDWAFLTIAYSLFLWASLAMVTLMRSHPDMLMSGFVYMAAGLLIRIRNGATGWQIYSALGAILGLAYLAKAAMFPLGILLLGTTLFFAGDTSRKLKGVAAASLCFAIVGGPFVVAVSQRADRPTFGEAGTLDYLWKVDHIDVSYYQNLGSAAGWVLHPIKKIIEGDPPAFSFARPIRATYSLWYDPSYWIEGIRPVFHWQSQVRVFLDNLRQYAQIGASLAGLLIALLLSACAAGIRQTIRSLSWFWPLYLWCAVALGGYAAILVQERYIGAFIALIGTCLFYGFRLSSPFPSRATLALVIVVVLTLAANTASHARRDFRENASQTRLHDAEASLALHNLGIATGQPVASITPWVASGWARLARVQIIAEVPRSRAEQFWKASPERQAAVFNAFTGAGCKAVVSWIGERDVPPGWQRLASSPYAVHLLP